MPKLAKVSATVLHGNGIRVTDAQAPRRDTPCIRRTLVDKALSSAHCSSMLMRCSANQRALTLLYLACVKGPTLYHNTL